MFSVELNSSTYRCIKTITYSRYTPHNIKEILIIIKVTLHIILLRQLIYYDANLRTQPLVGVTVLVVITKMVQRTYREC